MIRFDSAPRTRLYVFALVLALFVPFGAACAKGVETVLHSFRGGTDGAYPQAGLLADKAGNLYGTTSNGGDPNCSLSNRSGCGTVFRLAPDGTETVLYVFHDKSDGGYPLASLVADKSGNVFGTTFVGGNLHCTIVGCGTVFELTPNGVEAVLHAFSPPPALDGQLPWAGLVINKESIFYGTTYNGGNFRCNEFVGCGIAFKLTLDGTETILHSFAGASDGSYPEAGLLIDSAGNLYGTTENGGGGNCTINAQPGCGTVFKLTPQGVETVLYAFRGGNDGAFPLAGLFADTKGNLYGTASQGGKLNDGIVFEISPQGSETTLVTFDGAKRGADPQAVLIADKNDNLYSTTVAGGASNAGTVFKLSPLGKETVLYSFLGGSDGANPHAGVIKDGPGNLYGTTENGGACGYGTIYRISRELAARPMRVKRKER